MRTFSSVTSLSISDHHVLQCTNYLDDEELPQGNCCFFSVSRWLIRSQGGMYTKIREMFGDGLVTAEGDRWKSHRRLLSAGYATLLNRTFSLFSFIFCHFSLVSLPFQGTPYTRLIPCVLLG